MSEVDLDDLAEALKDFAEPEKKGGRPAREERIIAGFEDIQRFVDEHKRLPLHGEGRDIFERLYAVRLDKLRQQADCRAILTPLDRQGLLGDAIPAQEEVDDDALMAELEAGFAPSEIETLVHVKRVDVINAADEIASRKQCVDFDKFKPLFQQVQKELEAGVRETRRFAKTNKIEQADFFILGGQKGYVAEFGEEFISDYKILNRRLRVIFDNGTEINMLLRSLQRALYKDESGRRITTPDLGPLFSDAVDLRDSESGTIYVLRSHSKNPKIADHREVIHKIGVTGNDVQLRISSAKVDPTFLFAEVEIVATYQLFNINRMKLENLIHKIFEPARLDLEIPDNFGRPYRPREWFLAPLTSIDEAVNRIKDGSITDYVYDPKVVALVKAS